MRRIRLFLTVIASLVCVWAVAPAHAQNMDITFGMTTMYAPSANQASGGHNAQSLNGGLYPVFGGDFLLFKNFGIGTELAWKGSQGTYYPAGFNLGYRPLFYDFNAVWAPKVAKRTHAELMGGLGAISTRFYTGTSCNYYTCTNYSTSNHFLGHFAGGIRFYPYGNFFIRPEAHVYLINNNWEFSSAHAIRYGVSIGYTLGER